jgi:general secretion pathway protein F/MSHA biogenesis protein MshG
MYKNNKPYKEKVDTYILKVYLIGDVIFYASMNRFMLIFTELVRAGVPIVEALDTAVMTVDNENIKGKLSNVKVSVQRGANLTESFEDTELFEGMLIQMVKAGEQGGALDKMLEKVTDYYKNRFQNIIENMSAYIEPILIGFIAGMVLMLIRLRGLFLFLRQWLHGKALPKTKLIPFGLVPAALAVRWLPGYGCGIRQHLMKKRL